MVVSLVAHVTAAVSFESVAKSEPPTPPSETDIDVVPVQSESWEKNRTAAPPPPASSHANNSDKPPPKETLPSGQIVDVAAGNHERPDDPKYLAEHDNRVAKETRAREQTPFYAQAMPRQTNVQETAQDKQVKGNQGTTADEIDKTQKQKTQVADHEIPKTVVTPKVATFEKSEDGEARAPGDSSNTNGLSERLRLKPGMLAAAEDQPGSDGKAGVPDAPEHPGSAGVPGAAVGAAPNDFLQVPVGDGTFLNTREFKYASFFNRVKQRVGEQWSPSDVLRRRDPRGRTSVHTRVTVVDVTLDTEGRISDIQVNRSCGIDFLDEEAVAAFQRAQPFPNPPTGLFDGDGHIRFRFGFHLDNHPAAVSPFQFGSGRGHW